MKQLIIILLIAMSMSCKDKKLPIPTTPETKYGTISGLTINGENIPRMDMKLEIVGNYFYICNTRTYGISVIHQMIANTRQQELFSFILIPIDKLGKISLSPDLLFSIRDTCDFTPRSSFFMLKGNDQVIARYNLSKSGENYLLIQSFDKANSIVTGSINATYIAVETSETSRAIYPDTLRFENAKFTVPLNN